jgi:hypothetical protein
MLTNPHIIRACGPAPEGNLSSRFPSTQTATHGGSSDPNSGEGRSAVSKREEFFDFVTRSPALLVQEPIHNADIDWMIDGSPQPGE